MRASSLLVMHEFVSHHNKPPRASKSVCPLKTALPCLTSNSEDSRLTPGA